MTRFCWVGHDEKDDGNVSSSAVETDTAGRHYKNIHSNNSCNSSNDLVYSDDDDDDDDEHADVPVADWSLHRQRSDRHPCHTASSSSSWRSRYAVSDKDLYDDSDDDDDDDSKDDDDRNDTIIQLVQVQQFPPLPSYRNPTTASVATLRNLCTRQSRFRSSSCTASVTSGTTVHPHTNSNPIDIVVVAPGIEQDMQRLTQLLNQVQMTSNLATTNTNTYTYTGSTKTMSTTTASTSTASTSSIQQYQSSKRIYEGQKEQRQQIRREMEKIQYQMQLQHQQAQEALQQLIQRHEATARQIQNALIAQQAQEQQEPEQQEETKLAQQDNEEEQEEEDDDRRRRRHRSTEEPNEPDSSTPTRTTTTTTTTTTRPLDAGREDPRPDDDTQPASSSTTATITPRVDASATSTAPSSSTRPNNNNNNNISTTTTTTTASNDSTPAEPPQEEYITRAIKLRAQLIDLEKSVAEYDNATDAILRQKRLRFKKLVNGKINTLAEHVGKIRDVATEVVTAIANTKNEDQNYKSSAATTATTSNTKLYALGKRYLVNLLSSKVIVRIQAEGFNGQRGDGFPLAHMLSIVAANAKDIIPVLTAHLYTVCPTAIPTLPSMVSLEGRSSSSNSCTNNTNSNNSDEDDFMSQLGMIRQKDGHFESFERFLSRTEGIISLVANIMASEPSNHLLLGGHGGAIKWLKRFLAILPPPPQSPLPLITAPVLDAFLTGAGHMMANVHTELFQQYLDVITNDICTRLDESSIGMPSATRLRKTIKNGMPGFRTTLPSKALPELYYGANGSGGHASATPSPFGASQVRTRPLFGSSNSTVASSANSSISSAFGSSSNPFGSNAEAVNTPFGISAGTTKHNQSPFVTGAGSSAPSTSPFQSSNSDNNPFGNGSTASQSPFGGGTSTNNSLFVSSTTASSSLYGNTSNFSSFPSSDTSGNQQQSPFTGSSNFGSINSTNPSPFPASTTPFGGGGGGASATSPFGSSTASSIPVFNSPAPATSPFGQPAGNIGNTPFGGGNSLTSQSPFGTSHIAPPAAQNNGFFGGSNPMSTPSPFGSSSTPFGSSNIAPSPTPFSNNIQQQPFGGGATNLSSSSPFGGGISSQQQQMSSSSFAFGGQQSTNFGNVQQQGGNVFGGTAPSHRNNDTRPPCKFFAKGTCRNGANCNFSHSTTGSNNTGGQFSNNYNNNNSNTPFGGNNSSNPFGGPRR